VDAGYVWVVRESAVRSRAARRSIAARPARAVGWCHVGGSADRDMRKRGQDRRQLDEAQPTTAFGNDERATSDIGRPGALIIRDRKSAWARD